MNFTTKFASDNIDKAQGIIRSVSLISIGEVQGHSCYADAKTLATVLAAAKKAKKLKCKIDHGSSVSQICGSLTNFRLSDDGQKVLGDLKLFEELPFVRLRFGIGGTAFRSSCFVDSLQSGI